MRDLGHSKAGGAIEPLRPARGCIAIELRLKVGVVPFQEPSRVPISAFPEAGKGLTRAVPPPEEVEGESPNQTGLGISMAQRGAILQPAVLVGFTYGRRNRSS